MKKRKISRLECAYIHLSFTVDEDVEPPRPRPKPTTTTSTMSPTSISMFYSWCTDLS